MILFLLLLQWTSFNPHYSGIILSGNWQSCQVEGKYEEKAYDHTKFDKSGKPYIDWSFHMGPYDQFGLFVDEPNPDDHASSLNLLGSKYKSDNPTATFDHRRWQIRELGLQIDIRKAGGSRNDCESFYIEILKTNNSK